MKYFEMQNLLYALGIQSICGVLVYNIEKCDCICEKVPSHTHTPPIFQFLKVITCIILCLSFS